MHNVHHQDLKILLETVRPSSLLLIDPHPSALPETRLPANCQVTRLTQDVYARLQELGRFELGVIANTLEYMDRKIAGMVIARLRDLNTRRFVALAPIGKNWEGQRSHWEGNDFFGYGMSLMARYRIDGKPLHLYHYAIESYKPNPEWFNSRYWAHPELWKP